MPGPFGSIGAENDEATGTPGGGTALPNVTPVPFDTKGGNLVDPDMSSQSAAGMAATILRAQFQDWQTTFMPIELNAMQQLSFNNPEVLTKATDKAKETATGAYGAMRGVLDRQNFSQGILPTPQQANVSKRLMDLNKAAATAGAENKAREDVRANDSAVILGTAPNPEIVKTLSS